MSREKTSSLPISRPSPVVVAAVCFFYITVVLRTLAEGDLLASWLVVYLALEFLYAVLYILVLVRPTPRAAWCHLYFVFQSILALSLLIPFPQLDFLNVLLVLLSFQVAIIFPVRVRWVWVPVLLLLIVLSLTVLLRWFGLALSLMPATIAIVLPAYAAITQEIETRQREQQALLDNLQQVNRQLTVYAGQVKELAGLQERNRLARELHDSVSQIMFSIALNSRAARILLERDPGRLRSQLEQLQSLSSSALEQMRSLIADLRPQIDETGERTTP